MRDVSIDALSPLHNDINAFVLGEIHNQGEWMSKFFLEFFCFVLFL